MLEGRDAHREALLQVEHNRVAHRQKFFERAALVQAQHVAAGDFEVPTRIVPHGIRVDDELAATRVSRVARVGKIQRLELAECRQLLGRDELVGTSVLADELHNFRLLVFCVLR